MRLIACQLSEANNTKHMDSQEVTDILVSSSTQRQCQTYINKWFEFPAGRDCDPFTPDVAIILEFMAKYYNEGASYSTINTIRSALSTFITIEGHPVGSVNIVRRFVRGIFQLRPSLPKKQCNLGP